MSDFRRHSYRIGRGRVTFSPIITATASPALAALTDGDNVLAAVTSGTYASTAGTIDPLVHVTTTAFKNGIAADPDVVAVAGDEWRFEQSVTDSAGTPARVFGTGTRVVAAAPVTITVATTGDTGEIIFDPIARLDSWTGATGGDGEIVLTEAADGAFVMDEVLYRLKSTAGLWTRVVGSAPITVTGLNNGAVYEYAKGDGTIGEVTAGASGFTAPAAPPAPSLAGGVESVSLVIAATAGDGGSVVTGYTYEVDVAAGDFSKPVAQGTQLPVDVGQAIPISPLVAGDYKARTIATNEVGDSPPSAPSATATATAAVPGEFTIDDLPFDHFVFASADDLVTADVTLTGTGTTGETIEARAGFPGDDQAWHAGTVAGDGTWSITFSMPRAAWQGRYYIPQARRALDPGTILSGANTFGCGAVIGFLGQSELAYLMLRTPFYTVGTYPVSQPENMVLVTNEGASAIAVPITGANNTARAYPTAMTALSNMFNLALPDVKFAIVDYAQAGTSFNGLMDDQDLSRSFEPFLRVTNLMRAGNSDVSHIIWCWWNSTASGMKSPRAAFGPGLLGVNADGTEFDISDPSTTYDHTFFDALVAPDQFGRGIFRKDKTKFIFMLPGLRVTAAGGPDSHRSYSYTSTGAFRDGMRKQNDAPAIAAGAAMMADAIWQGASGGSFISPTVCRFGDYTAGIKDGPSSSIHPSITDARGTRMLAMHMGAAALASLGEITEPVITGTALGAAGAHADVFVSLPTGTTLTTLRILDAIAVPAPKPPHWQEVMGFEIRRSGDADSDRRPVHRTDDTSVPEAYRGTVVIQDAGTAGVATIRITPTVAFAEGDALEFQRGGGFDLDLHGAADYDARMYLDLPIAHLPRLYDGTIHSYPGIPVRPQPPLMVLSGATEPPPAVNDGAFAVTDAAGGFDVAWDDAILIDFTVEAVTGGISVAWQE